MQADILVAYQKNGANLPMLNGYPVRLIVPGWYATYWVKNLSEIAGTTFEKFYEASLPIPTRLRMRRAGRTGAHGVQQPHTPLLHRLAESCSRVSSGRRRRSTGSPSTSGYGIREVQFSDDGGATRQRARLGPDLGRYSFGE